MRIEYGDTLYCDTDDVARYFDKVQGFDASTEPTKAEVESFIEERCVQIDRHTDHAFRDNRVVEEMKDLDGPYYWHAGIPLGLSKREIRPLDSNEGDKLEVWNGSEWEDWLTDSSYNYGRNEDYWYDKASGIVYIRDRYVFNRHPQIRLSYRYGRPTVPPDIQQACAKFVAADLLESEQFVMTNISGSGESAIEPRRTTRRYREDAEQILDQRRETSHVEVY